MPSKIRHRTGRSNSAGPRGSRRPVFRRTPWCRNGQWCPDCRSVPVATCRCRHRLSAGCEPVCQELRGSLPLPEVPVSGRSVPRTGDGRWHRRRWPPTRGEKSPVRSRGSGRRGPKAARPRRQNCAFPMWYRSSGPSMPAPICACPRRDSILNCKRNRYPRASILRSSRGGGMIRNVLAGALS